MTDSYIVYAAGARVGVAGPEYAGRAFTVEKVNPKTYDLVAEDGEGRPLRVRHGYVTAAPEAGADRPAPPGPAAHLVAGTLVRYNGPENRVGISPGSLAVVMVDKFTRVNIAKLGGYEDRYLRAFHQWVEVVDPATVLR